MPDDRGLEAYEVSSPGVPASRSPRATIVAAALIALACGLLFGVLFTGASAQQQGTGASAGGAKLYQGHGCIACHGESGEGVVAPALAGNVKLFNSTYLVDQILFGGGGMPGFRRQLSDGQVAEVATYIGEAWGNDLDPIELEFVTQRRTAGADEPLDRWFASPAGSQVYAWNCMICHGVNGGGGVGPPLAGNSALADTAFVVAQIQLGGGGMPPFAPILDSQEVAGVASYIRGAWGNGFEPVSAQHVALQWEGLATAGTGSASAQGDSGADGGAQGGSETDEPAAGGGSAQAGEELYSSLGCAACHSSEGAGGIGPPLDGNPALADAEFVVATIRDGRRGMPQFGHMLRAEGLASVASYVRTAWRNDFGPVEVSERDGLPASLLRSQVDPIPMGPLQVAGEQLYAAVGCAGCHSSEGAGGIGPPLDGNVNLEDRRYVIDTILTGGERMPSFSGVLTNEQIAALASHVRTSWTNDYGLVATEEVSRARPVVRPSSGNAP